MRNWKTARRKCGTAKPISTSIYSIAASKARHVIAAETESSLATTPGFDWLDFSRAEVHVYNLRHLFHHAGQLSLRQRINVGEGVKWIHSGWSD